MYKIRCVKELSEFSSKYIVWALYIDLGVIILNTNIFLYISLALLLCQNTIIWLRFKQQSLLNKVPFHR
jgi:hypothetical protein